MKPECKIAHQHSDKRDKKVCLAQSQHTPGPWKVFGSFKQIVHQVGDKYEVLTEVKYPLFTMDVEEAKANARLIAAAPELLKAAKNARNILAALITGDLKEIKADSLALQLLRDAIATAEGQ